MAGAVEAEGIEAVPIPELIMVMAEDLLFEPLTWCLTLSLQPPSCMCCWPPDLHCAGNPGWSAADRGIEVMCLVSCVMAVLLTDLYMYVPMSTGLI